jgi:hypothetical protein
VAISPIIDGDGVAYSRTMIPYEALVGRGRAG